MGNKTSQDARVSSSARGPSDSNEDEIIFRNVKVTTIMDAKQETIAAFKKELKKKAPITLEYFNCMESIVKRKQAFDQSVKMGDSNEKTTEYLKKSASEIVETYGDLPFENNALFTDLRTAAQTLPDLAGVDVFDIYAEKCKEHVQFYLTYRA